MAEPLEMPCPAGCMLGELPGPLVQPPGIVGVWVDGPPITCRTCNGKGTVPRNVGRASAASATDAGDEAGG